MDKKEKLLADSKILNSAVEYAKENGLEEGFGYILDVLALDDEDFKTLFPSFVKAIEQSFNDPNFKLGMSYGFQEANGDIEELRKIILNAQDELKSEGALSEEKLDFMKIIFGLFLNAIVEGNLEESLMMPVQRLSEDVKLPQYAHLSDSGMDVFALDDYEIMPGETKLIPTGLKVAVPSGYELQVRPKSGRALKTKLRVANTPGTIDAGYRDEIKVIIENIEPAIRDIGFHYDEDKLVIDSIEKGRPYNIGKGEKFAQLVLCKVSKAVAYEIKDINSIEGNRGGGFGSTGLKN